MRTSRSTSTCFWTRASFMRFSQKRSSRRCLISAMRCMAWTVWTQRSRLYWRGSLRFFSNYWMGSWVSSLLWSLRQALVQASLRGLCLALKCRWHLGRQKRKFLQSLRTNITPCPGQTGPEQKQHLQILINNLTFIITPNPSPSISPEQLHNSQIVGSPTPTPARGEVQTWLSECYNISGLILFKMSGVVSIEGNLGAGKSTLLSMLVLSLIPEPVEAWANTAGTNMVQRYYSDPKRWSFTFQLNALHSRSLLWRQALRSRPQETHFSERSPMADRYIFGEIMRNEGNMDAAEFEIYDSLCQTLMQDCPVRAIIYLKCQPEICYGRIQARNRTGEEGIPLEYLQKVHDRHEEWLGRQKDLRVLTVNTGALDISNPDQLGEVMLAIQQFIASLGQ